MNEQALSATDFQNDVAEYKQMEEAVAKDFLNGVIKLGAILHKQKDKWKPQNKWTEYLGSIGRTLAGANQFIRIYEYSIDNAAKLVNANLTNWAKLNMFLSLPAELRDKISEEVDGQVLSNDEFRETINNVKPSQETVIQDDLDDGLDITDVQINTDEVNKLDELLEGATLADVKFMSKKVLEEFVAQGFEFSNSCLPIIEGFLGIEKVCRDMSVDNFAKLNKGEKDFWIGNVKMKLNSLVGLVNQLASE